MPRNPHGRKCTAKSKQSGKQCARWAKPGALVCESHGAAAPQVAAAAAVRAEVMQWGLGDTDADPGEMLLRLIDQAKDRVERLSQEIDTQVAQHGLMGAMTGESFVMSDDGKLQKVGEYVRALAALENQERDRLAKFSTLAINAGLAERQTRLAERQGLLIEAVLASVFDEIGLTVEQRALAPAALRKAITAA